MCPRPPLVFGIICSLLMTVTSFATPWVQGKIYDAASDGYHRACHHGDCDRAVIDEAWWGQIVPLAGVVAGLMAAAWLFEVASHSIA